MSSNQTICNVAFLSTVAALEQPSETTMRTTASKTIDSTPAPLRGAIADNSAPAPSNDNATGGGIPDTTHLVARADVVQYIRATLRRHGVASQDMADAIADVQLDSIEVARTRRMPASVTQWKALAATIAVRRAIDRLRETDARSRSDAGLCDDADAYALTALHCEQRDPGDTKRYLTALNDLFDSGQMPEHAAEILWGEAEQTPHAEIAKELGVTETVVDNRLSRMRTTFRTRLGALGLLTLALLLPAALHAPLEESAAPAARTERAEPAPPVRCVPASDAGAPHSQHSSSPVRGYCAASD